MLRLVFFLISFSFLVVGAQGEEIVPLGDVELRFELPSGFKPSTEPPRPGQKFHRELGALKVMQLGPVSEPVTGEALRKALQSSLPKAKLSKEVDIKLADGRPASLVRAATRMGVRESLLFAESGRTIEISLYFARAKNGGQREQLKQWASELSLGPAGNEQTQTKPPSEVSAKGKGNLFAFIVISLFTVLPAYIGAGIGFDRRQQGGSSKPEAGWAFCSVLGGAACGFVVALIGLVLFYSDKQVSGITDATGALLIFGGLAAFGASILGIFGGIFAGLGAALGGTHSRGRCQLLAALGCLLGMLLSPFIMKLLPKQKRKKSFWLSQRVPGLEMKVERSVIPPRFTC